MGKFRAVSYGQSRQFRGIERWAIQRRQLVALESMKRLVQTRQRDDIEIIELGCGYRGETLELLAERYPQSQFTGVDISVAEKISHNQIRLIQADLTTWKPGREYDLVFSLAVAEHLVDPVNHFALIAGCLKPEGIGVLATPTPRADFPLRVLAALGIFDKNEICDHKLYLTEEGIRHICQLTGMQITDYREISLGMSQVTLLVR